ncbi:PREDICTED: uncharacterized protein LOC108362249, partial [Rhagoletis zephyria]|uniref:uncharacterized protein LOC108362249 n=1 Tax=Rhagoletis zephyria TaxID=28612 RepID=UPI0008112624
MAHGLARFKNPHKQSGARSQEAAGLTGNRPINRAPLTELEQRAVAIVGSHYIEGHESVVDNVPMEEELQLALEDGEELILTEISPESAVPCNWYTPKSPAQKTPRRSWKRKREEDESEVQIKYMEIAQKQADAMQMLAEGFTRLVEVQATSASFIQTLGEGMKSCADAINNLAK